MTVLRVVLDDVLARAGRSAARYAAELSRALIETAPDGCGVEAVTAAASAEQRAELAALLPGLGEVHAARLPRRELELAWRFGAVTSPRDTMLHSPSLLAPLRARERERHGAAQTTVTVHDLAAWHWPETLPPRRAAWERAMLARAERHADAVVVPTHAVADGLRELSSLGDRIRVAGAAVAASLRVPDDTDAVAARLGLPERYVLSTASLNPRRGLDALLDALRGIDAPLVLAGEPDWREHTLEAAARERGIAPARILRLGELSDAELAVVYSRAAVFANPSLEEGFGLASLEAFSLGAPVVNSDAPALEEVAAGAGLVVERGPAFAENLAEGIQAVLDNDELAERLRIKGRDRAGAFSWHDSAEKIWQLHADL